MKPSASPTIFALCNKARRRVRQDGQALVEFTFVALMLLLLVFGLIDFGRAILTKQIIAGVTREAGNLASRGTTLSNTLSSVQVSAVPLDLANNGYVILTVVFRDTNGQARITGQLTSGSYSTTSKMGMGTNTVVNVLPTSPEIPQRGQSVYVAEISYKFKPITPLGKLMFGVTSTNRLSDIAYF